MTNISSVASKSEWAASLEAALHNAERAEELLSYAGDQLSEAERKVAGSYYTPVDVARHFWSEYCLRSGIFTAKAAQELLQKYHFIEPAAGAGVLFFSLLDQMSKKGADVSSIAGIHTTFVDVNASALEFIRGEISKIERRFKLAFKNVSYIHSDFRDCSRKGAASKPLFIFGNPPFVDTRHPGAPWRNLFADFVDIALEEIADQGVVQFIVPLSIAFSRDYAALRQKMRLGHYAVDLSSFDNIPDTLFKAGKPRHTNTNKANSQRCSIITIAPARRFQLRSSGLIRWRRRERQTVLSAPTPLLDASLYEFDGQFPRPANSKILDYLRLSEQSPRFGERINARGRFPIFVAGVARNFIGLRMNEGAGCTRLGFSSATERLKFALLLSSDLFFDYWLTVGDGFHLTKSNITSFPLSDKLDSILDLHVQAMDEIWRSRQTYVKSKLNAGTTVRTLDFSQAVPSLYERLGDKG